MRVVPVGYCTTQSLMSESSYETMSLMRTSVSSLFTITPYLSFFSYSCWATTGERVLSSSFLSCLSRLASFFCERGQAWGFMGSSLRSSVFFFRFLSLMALRVGLRSSFSWVCVPQPSWGSLRGVIGWSCSSFEDYSCGTTIEVRAGGSGSVSSLLGVVIAGCSSEVSGWSVESESVLSQSLTMSATYRRCAGFSQVESVSGQPSHLTRQQGFPSTTFFPMMLSTTQRCSATTGWPCMDVIDYRCSQMAGQIQSVRQAHKITYRIHVIY